MAQIVAVRNRAGLIALSAALVAGSVLVYFFRFDLEEPRRYLMALATLGFFFAPLSEKPLRVGLWLLGVAVVAWGAQIAGSGQGGFPLWLACSVAGALLVVRGGSRAARYYLPGSRERDGRRLPEARHPDSAPDIGHACSSSDTSSIGGSERSRSPSRPRSSALRSPPVQAPGNHRHPASRDPGIVPSQRWAVLVLFGVVGGTSLPRTILGEDRGSLLLTAALLLVTAALIFVLSLTRMGWPRAFVRRASFAAGVVLAVAVTAVLVELESWDPSRYRVFASFCIGFLVVLPFRREARTKLFLAWPRLRLSFLRRLRGMTAPVTAIGGIASSSTSSTRSSSSLSPSSCSPTTFSVDLRAEAKAAIYLAASLGLVLYLFFGGIGDRGWQVFLLSLGFVLYAIDRLERVWRESRSRERIPTQ